MDATASIEKGKEARGVASRRDLGAYEPAADRRDPVEILVEQGADRQPDLLPIRYGRMAASPFAFLRGAAAVMAADLAPSPVTGLRVQAIGDAHISNFGVFATPERRLVFDVNDFDETLPAPWEWDVKRLVASVAVAAQENGAGRKAAAAAAERGAAAYRAAMRDLAGQAHARDVVRAPRRGRPRAAGGLAQAPRPRPTRRSTRSAGGRAPRSPAS